MQAKSLIGYTDGLNGVTVWGTYKGVRVGIKKANGQIATVFPAIVQPRRKR